jgi:hypothetical protein
MPHPPLVRSPLLAALLLLAPVGVCGSVAESLAQWAPEATSCRSPQSSLARLGCRLGEQLGAGARGATVTVLDLKSDRPLPNPDALRDRLRATVTDALGRSAEPSKWRVELTVEKAGGVLRVTADLRRALGLWQRLRREKPRSEAHAFVEVPLDGELRTLIPPPPLVVSETLRMKAPERGVVAVACGPLGPEGGQELVLVSRSAVRVGRIQGRAFVQRAGAAWSSLSPIAPSPLREPLASAEITPEGSIRVGLSDRRDGLTLDRDLRVTARHEGVLPVPGGGCAGRRGGLGLQVLSCGATPGRAPPVTGPELDALAGGAGGWLGRALDTHVLISSEGGSLLPQTPVGAQLALGDADSDGARELAHSADTLEPQKDALTLVTLGSDGPIARFTLPMTGISALAICERQEGAGMTPLVVATAEELWLLR